MTKKEDKAIKRMTDIANRDLIDLVSGSMSVEDWAKEIDRTYHRGVRRPDVMILMVERYGECYNGSLYITKRDFHTRIKI